MESARGVVNRDDSDNLSLAADYGLRDRIDETYRLLAVGSSVVAEIGRVFFAFRVGILRPA